MLPLIKSGQYVEYRMGKETFIGEVFNSNPTTVWVYNESRRIIKIHKKRHFVKIIEKPKKGKEVKKGKPSKALDDLIKDLPGSRSRSS